MRGHKLREATVRAIALLAVAFVALAVTPAGTSDLPPRRAGDASGIGDRLLSPFIVSYSRAPTAEDVYQARQLGGGVDHVFHLIPAMTVRLPAAAARALRGLPGVMAVEPDTRVELLAQELPWGVDRIDAELVHGYDKGTGVKVAVIDTGIDLDHPDLVVAGNVTFVPGTTTGDDDHGHGSHVAGTIGARDNGIGVIGVAPAVSLYAVKVLDATGSGSWSDVVKGLEWAVDNGMNVVNMSLGASSAPSAVETAVNNAYSAGVLLVAAAGNSGNAFGVGDNITYPARYDAVIAVVATDQSNQRASFSSTGPAAELAAPGVGINSTYKNGGYWTLSGTSMASPHVAGTAALVLAGGTLSDLNGDGAVNNRDLRIRLRDTADDLGAAGKDSLYGHGLVDANEAAPNPGANQPPVARTGGPYAGTEDIPVAFDGSTSSDPNGDPLTFLWKFGDGTTGTGSKPTHTYTSGGVYTVTLTVTDGKGGSGSDTTTATIAGVNDSPVAKAGPDQTVQVGQTVTLNGSGSFDPDGTIVEYRWSFGDGTTGSGAVVTHVYQATGVYTATLTVKDNGGAQASDSALITVVPTGQQALHVESIGMELVQQFGGWRTFAKATVTVANPLGVPVAGVTVKGHWENATTDVDSGTTDSSGRVVLQSDVLRKPAPGTTFVFVVDDLVKSGWSYNPQANKESRDSITL